MEWTSKRCVFFNVLVQRTWLLCFSSIQLMAEMKEKQGQGLDGPDSSDDEDDDMPALEPEGAKKESEAEQPTASGSGTSSS